MADVRPDHTAPAEQGAAEKAEQRRRARERRERVFGDVLPETTRDERGQPSKSSSGGHDDELRRNVPPHHG